MLIKPKDNNGTCPGGWWIGGYNLGFEHTVVQVGGEKYLGRWIFYILGRSFRLHKFYRGDDMRAPHDHPWPFWTFPLCRGYWELVLDVKGELKHNWVPGWRVSYRPSNYEHIVEDPAKPFWTIVVTGKKDNGWGFWPEFDRDTTGTVRRIFVPWREWK